MRCPTTRAFSLAELLTVISIIIILASLILVGIGETFSTAERVRCQHNLEQLGLACQMWSSANQARELAAIGTYGGRTGLWYRELRPYLSSRGSVGNLRLALNCPLVERELAGGEEEPEEWGGGPDILFSYDRYRSWFDFIALTDDLRSAGWRGAIHLWERHPVNEPGVFHPITDVIQDYGIFTYIDAWYGKQFTQAELDAVTQFQQNPRSIFVSCDHHPSFDHVLNQLADHCHWGLWNGGLVDHRNNGEPFPIVSSHPIGEGVTQFRGYDSEGRIQIPAEQAKRNPYASLVLFCSLPEHQGDPPCAITGTMDDGKLRLVLESNWTKFASPRWSYGGAWKEDHFRYVQNIYNWLLERSGDGDRISYGYSNQVGGTDRTTGDRRPSPVNRAETVRILDYEDFIADHDGDGTDDPDSYIATRHGGRANVLFVDGRVEALTLDQLRRDNYRLWRTDQ